MRRRLLSVLLLPVLAACGGTDRGALRSGGTAAGAGGAADDPAAALPADARVAGYTGAFARDPAVVRFLRDAGPIARAAIERLRDETGLQFVEGRLPRVLLVDTPEVPAEGRADLRLVDGLRRPEIRVRAAAVVTGEFRPADHLPARIAEAGVLAASPERAPPEWVRTGLPTVFAKQVERRVAEVLAGGPAVRAADDALAPLDSVFRVAALRRIGTGDRVLARFLDVRLSGGGDAAALREVGVGGIDFLDAAAATDARRALDKVRRDERFQTLRTVRDALAAEDVPSAESALARTIPAGPVSWFDAELGLARALTSLARAEVGAAAAELDDVLTRPDLLLRLREARALRALVAQAEQDPTAPRRAAEFALACPDHRESSALLHAIGVAPQDAADLAGADAPGRARAVLRIAEAGGPGAVPCLLHALTDGDAAVRAAAIESLAARGAKETAPQLDLACADTEATVRAAAIRGLAALDLSRAARRARDLTSDPDAVVRNAATEVIARANPAPPPRVAVPSNGGAKPPVKDTPAVVPVPRTAQPRNPPKSAPPAVPPQEAGPAAAPHPPAPDNGRVPTKDPAQRPDEGPPKPSRDIPPPPPLPPPADKPKV